MPIYHGSNLISALKHGSTNIAKVYKGSTLVFAQAGGGGGPAPSIFTTDELTPKWLADASPSTLIVANGTGADWDLYIREIGNVIDEGSAGAQRYKLTYTGHNDASYSDATGDITPTYIGWAYSSDGVTWTKGGELITARSLEDPFVIKSGGTYYLYAEDKADDPFRNIRLFTSTDFVNWTDEGDVLDAGSSGAWDDQDVSSPTVWREGSTWKMLYEGRKVSGQQGAIGLATSSDGLTWTKDAGNPVLEAGDTAWASAIVPDDVMIGNDGTYVLLFHGLTAGKFRAGVAHSADLYSWTDPLDDRTIRFDVFDHFTVQFHPVGSDLHFIYARDSGTGIRQGDDMGYEVLVVNFTGANGSTSFTDESAWGRSLTANGNAQIQSNKLDLDGSGDFVSAPDSPQWFLGTEPFTLEAFGVEFKSSPGSEMILNHGTADFNDQGWLLAYIGGQLRFYSATSVFVLLVAYTWAPTTNTPYDLTVERSGNTFRLYINGARVASATNSMALFDASTTMTIGRQHGATPVDADIRMKAARVTIGKALYATDASYTVPTLPLVPSN